MHQAKLTGYNSIPHWGVFYTPKGLFVVALMLRHAVSGFEVAHQSCSSYFYKSVLKHVQENPDCRICLKIKEQACVELFFIKVDLAQNGGRDPPIIKFSTRVFQ